MREFLLTAEEVSKIGNNSKEIVPVEELLRIEEELCIRDECIPKLGLTNDIIRDLVFKLADAEYRIATDGETQHQINVRRSILKDLYGLGAISEKDYIKSFTIDSLVYNINYLKDG